MKTSRWGTRLALAALFLGGAWFEVVASDVLLIKVDAEGNEIWVVTYGEPNMVETAHVVTETTDGRYVCAGWQERDLYQYTDNLLLAAFDSDGALLWEDVTGMNVHITFGEILAHPDGSYVIVGSAARPGRPFRIQLLKLDPDGT